MSFMTPCLHSGPMLGLQVEALTWVLGAWAQALRLMHQGLYWLSHAPSPPYLIFKNSWTPEMSGYLLISSSPPSVIMTGFLLSTVLSAVFLKLQWTLGIGYISVFVIAPFWIPSHFWGNYSLTSNCLGCLCFEFKSISLGTFLWFSESILLRLKSVWDK